MTTQRDAASDLAVCEAATKGPWLTDEWYGSEEGGWAAIGPHHLPSEDADFDEDNEPDGPVHERAKKDSAFIALARTALPYWIREAVAQRERAERAEARWSEEKRSNDLFITENLALRRALGNAKTKIREALDFGETKRLYDEDRDQYLDHTINDILANPSISESDNAALRARLERLERAGDELKKQARVAARKVKLAYGGQNPTTSAVMDAIAAYDAAKGEQS
jgi:hypothetical protein